MYLLSPDSTFFTLDVWVHVVATISSSAQSLYGNGQLVSTQTNSPSFLPNMVARSQQYIGKSNWGADGFFAGTIAYVRIWNGYALSATEVLSLYNKLRQQGSPGAASCLSCSAGYYSTGAASACTSCPGGQYQGSTGAASCSNCIGGYFSTGSSSACTSCPKGHYSGASGSISCFVCSSGTQSTAGATSCSSQPTPQPTSKPTLQPNLKRPSLPPSPLPTTAPYAKVRASLTVELADMRPALFGAAARQVFVAALLATCPTLTRADEIVRLNASAIGRGAPPLHFVILLYCFLSSFF